MEFRKDTDVYAADGDQMGQIDRVVIDPRTKEVTHIVIRKGFFFTEDKVIPLDRVVEATEEKVTLRWDEKEVDDLPDFEETHYIAVNEEELARSPRPTPYLPSFYWYPPAVLPVGYSPGYYPSYIEPPYVTEVEQNIPEGTVALKEGAKVIAADGEHVGNVEELLTDSQTDRVTHVVISQGLIFKERKQVPSAWIEDVGEDEIHLAVLSRTLDDLRPYES